MAIKRVLLPFVDGGSTKPTAEAAFLVGRLFAAQIRGVLARHSRLDVPFAGEYVDTEAMQQILEAARNEEAARRKRIEALFADLSGAHPAVDAQFVFKVGDPADTAAHEARLADLSVLPGGSDKSGALDEVRDAALFRSGRPMLLVPPSGIKEQHFDRVVIAWKDSVESARAMAAAQPFLQRAEDVRLISVGEDPEDVLALQDVEQYLLAHYAAVRTEAVPHAPGVEVGQTLLDVAQEGGSTLLVMGAYSHWRWRQRVFGGVTQTLLQQTSIPVLMTR